MKLQSLMLPVLVVVLWNPLLVQAARTAAKPASFVNPVKSKEDVYFLNRKEDELLALGKVPEFVGSFQRTYEKNPQLRFADLYTFKGITASRVDKAVCANIFSKIFGPTERIILKIQPAELSKSNTGEVCETSVFDPAPKSKVPERRVLAGFIKGKPYALVFKLTKKSTEEEKEGARKFWKSLK